MPREADPSVAPAGDDEPGKERNSGNRQEVTRVAPAGAGDHPLGGAPLVEGHGADGVNTRPFESGELFARPSPLYSKTCAYTESFVVPST